MKKILALAIIVALIVPSTLLLANPIVKAQGDTSSVHVLSNYTWYIAPNSDLAGAAGDFIVVGEIQNDGGSFLTSVNLTGTAYDSSGNQLATGGGIAFVYHTAPGQKAPFYVDFGQQNSTDMSWTNSVSTVSIVPSSVDSAAVPQYSGLTFPEPGGTHGFQMDPSTYAVVGIINNTGIQTAGAIWTVTTFYDTSGNVVALNFTSYLNALYNNTLAPGQTVSFLATPADNTAAISSEIANYSVTIDSMPGPGGSNNSPTTTSSPGPSNPISIPIIPIAAIAIVAVVAVVAFMFFRKRPGTTTPPPPPPPPPQA